MGMSPLVVVVVEGVLEAEADDEVPIVGAVVEGVEVGWVVAGGAARRMPLEVMTPGIGLVSGMVVPVLEAAARGSTGVGVGGGGDGDGGRDSTRFASSKGTDRREDLRLKVTRAFSEVQDMFV